MVWSQQFHSSTGCHELVHNSGRTHVWVPKSFMNPWRKDCHVAFLSLTWKDMKTLRQNRYNTKPQILGTLASESDPQEGTPTLTSNAIYCPPISLKIISSLTGLTTVTDKVAFHCGCICAVHQFMLVFSNHTSIWGLVDLPCFDKKKQSTGNLTQLMQTRFRDESCECPLRRL